MRSGGSAGRSRRLRSRASGTRPRRPAKPVGAGGREGPRSGGVGLAGPGHRAAGCGRRSAPAEPGAAPDRHSSAGSTTPFAVSAAGELGRSAPAAPQAAGACGRFGRRLAMARRHAPPARGPQGPRSAVVRAAAKAHEARRWGWAGSGGRVVGCRPERPGRTRRCSGPPAICRFQRFECLDRRLAAPAATELESIGLHGTAGRRRVRVFRRRGPVARRHAPPARGPDGPRSLLVRAAAKSHEAWGWGGAASGGRAARCGRGCPGRTRRCSGRRVIGWLCGSAGGFRRR